MRQARKLLDIVANVKYIVGNINLALRLTDAAVARVGPPLQHRHVDKYMTDEPLSTTQLEQFQQDGFIVLRGLFDAEEIELLGRAAKEDRVLDQNSFGRDDGSGGNVRLSLW